MGGTKEFGKVAVLMGGRARRGAAKQLVRESEADAERLDVSGEN
jgi:hypothetical protein